LLVELEPTRSAGGSVVVEREVAIGVGVASARRDVCGIDDVGVDELDFVFDAVVPVAVALLDVFAPEVCAFEEFGALGNFAAKLVDVFLKDEL
jgi:hypothetical protein